MTETRNTGGMGKRVFFLVIWSALVAVSAGAQDTAEAARAWRQARDHMAAGEPEQARAIFDALLRDHPSHNAFLLGRARACLAAGLAAEASADYAVLVGKFPDNPDLRREAAEAARLSGDTLKAGEWEAPPPVADLRAASLATLLPPRQPGGPGPQQPSKRTFISGSIRTGIMYDSNANQGPASEIFSLGSLTVTVPGSKAVSTMAAYLGANVDFLHRLGDNSPWAVVADAKLFARGNENRDFAANNTREWQWGRIGAGVRHVRGKNFFEARFKAEIFDYQLTNNISALGPELTYIRALTKDLHWISQASGDIRIFKRDPDRNSFLANAGQYLRVFFGDGKYSIMFGGRYIGNYARLRLPSYQGFELMARLNAAVTPKFQISPHVSFTRELYRRPATAMDAAMRRDNRCRLGIDLSYRVTERFSLEGNFQYVKNNSNGFLNSYTQRVAGGGVAWSF